MTSAVTEERRSDLGPQHFEQFLPPVSKKNYGKWKYHEVLKPGVMVHVAESGDRLYTVRAGSPRLISVDKIRMFCDLADKYCGGHLRFTSRHNVEFLRAQAASLDPLIERLCPIRRLLAAIVTSLSLKSRVKKLGFEYKWPKWAKNIYPAIIFFILLTWFELGWDATRSPMMTATMGVIMAVMAVLTATFLEKPAFCRYASLLG